MRLAAPLVVGLFVLVAAGCTPATRAAPSPSWVPATGVAPTDRVGPLFAHGLQQPHACTASVLDSPAGDLLLTAAHCVTGDGSNLVFAPGYDRGATPFGVWAVVAAYVDPAWSAGQPANRDYAVLRVLPAPGGSSTASPTPGPVEAVTGGLVLASAPAAGDRVQVVAYNSGLDDLPVTCTTSVYTTAGAPSFDCPGFVGGSSGSPWLAAGSDSAQTLVRGVIGGLHHGGCSPSTSYSSLFDPVTAALLKRAESGAPSDDVPVAGYDGC